MTRNIANKLLHAFVAFIIVIMFGSMHAERLGILIVITLIVCKEAVDYWRGGKFDLVDMFAGVIGIIAAQLTLLFADSTGGYW